MDAQFSPGLLAELCFRRVPRDVVARDVVLAALWHLHLQAAREGLPIGRTFRHTLLGDRSGMRAVDYRAGIGQLVDEGLALRARNGYGLTRAGFQAAGEIVDVSRAIAHAERSAGAAA